MAALEWTTERRRICDLVPYEHNPRLLTEKQAKDLEKSLKKFNLAEIPAINRDNTIIAGHMRLKLMVKAGRGSETIDVRVPNRALTEKEVAEYCVRSNKNTGDWGWDKLANEFDATDLLEWGFTPDDLKLTKELDDIGEDSGGGGAAGRGEVECPECGCKFVPKKAGKG